MPGPGRLRGAIEQTRREAKQLARDMRQANTADGSSVRCSGRHNIVVAANTGELGTDVRSIAIQSAPINQDGHSA